MNLKNKIKQLAIENISKIIEIRRTIHKNPELSFHEYKTSAYIKSILFDWGICFKDGFADTGIVAILKGKNPHKKCIALRADIDALPIKEKNKIEYCSKNSGVMHACGHDAHTASLLGTIKILDTLKNDWEGTIKFIFQPAEEKLPGGAKQMIKEGVLENPKVSNLFGQHVSPDIEVGKVGFKTGIYMASTDELYIRITGEEGHAALTNKTKNPIFIASKMLSTLYDYFEKEKANPSVFSIGFIQGNGSTNVIPEQVKMQGTLRAMDETWRNKAHKKMLKISYDFSQQYNLEIDFEIRKGYPFLENDEKLTKKAILLAKEFIGDNNVIFLPIKMTAEDFSYYTKEVSSCFYRLGTANKKKGITHGLHTSNFDIDEDALIIGMGLMTYLAIS